MQYCFMLQTREELKEFLDEKVYLFNQPNFIPDDPISIPHLFTKKQDIEILTLTDNRQDPNQLLKEIKKIRELKA